MSYTYNAIALTGITNANANPTAPRISPSTQRYVYVAYEDYQNNPTLATLAEIDMSTMALARHTAIAATDALCTFALAPSADQLVLASLVPGGAANYMKQIKTSDFTVLKTSAQFGAAFGFSLSDSPITVSSTGEWAVLSYTYDGTFGQYIVIWHTTTNVIYEGYLSSVVPLPNSIFSMCFDASDNLYMAIHVTGGLYKFTLSETLGVVSITLTNTFALPDASADVRAMHFQSSTNKLVLWENVPHSATDNVTVRFWNTLTDTIDATSYSLTPGSSNVSAGMSLWNKYGWTEATQFSQVFQVSGSSDCIFYIIDISNGATQAYSISLWNTDFGNLPPNAESVYSSTYSDIYTTNRNVAYADMSRIYLFNSIPPTPPTPPNPPTSGSIAGAWYIERMDNRSWATIEDAWCLDCALAWPMPTPAATLAASAASGSQNIGLYTVINGGSGYTAPTGQVLDLVPGGGSGATVAFAVSSGVIVSASYVTLGSGYKQPQLTILDTTGAGAVVQPIVTNYVTMSASANVFSASNVGDIVRIGGGKAQVVTLSDSATIIANIITPITAIVQNDPNNTPLAAASGSWTLTAPVTTVSGLDHLEGMTVAAIADGGAVTGLTVSAGSVTLPYSASQIVVGLPFTAQLQTLYLESSGGATLQTRRKNDTQVVLRVRDSAAPEVGVNQPDASTQPNQANVPWGAAPYTSMSQVVSRTPNVPAGTAVPLLSGDFPITNVFSTYDTKAQVAVQQTQPLPLTVLALVPWVTVGDSPGP